jgi:hypothetical protein
MFMPCRPCAVYSDGGMLDPYFGIRVLKKHLECRLKLATKLAYQVLEMLFKLLVNNITLTIKKNPDSHCPRVFARPQSHCNLQQHIIVEGALVDEELGVSCTNSEFVI